MTDKLYRVVIETVGDENLVQLQKQVSALQATIRASGQASNQWVTASGNMAKAANRNRAAIQNAGYQIQDFAVQVASGTSASRALAQQLPQLASGFGLWGVAIGTATAVFVPLIANILSTEEATKDVTDAMREFSSSVSEVQTLVSSARRPIADLREEYGDLADEIQRTDTNLARLQIEKTISDLSDQTIRLFDNTGMAEALKAFQQVQSMDVSTQIGNAASTQAFSLQFMREEFLETFGLGIEEATRLQTLFQNIASDIESGSVTQNTLDQLDAVEQITRQTKEWDTVWLSVVSHLQQGAKTAIDLRDATNDLDTAKLEQADAATARWNEHTDILAQNLRELGQSSNGLSETDFENILAAFEAAEKLRKEIGDAATNALQLANVDLTSPISSATLEAAKLAGQLQIGLNAALSLINQQKELDKLQYSGRGSGLEWSQPEGTGIGTDNVQSIIDSLTPPTPSGGGGGGLSEANDEWDRFVTILERARTPAEEARLALSDLYELAELYGPALEANAEYQELFNRSVADLQSEATSVNGLQESFVSLADAAGAALGSMAVGMDDTANVADTFKRTFAKIIGELIAEWLAFQAITALFGAPVAANIGLSNPFVPTATAATASAASAASAASVPATSSFASTVGSLAAVPAVSQLSKAGVRVPAASTSSGGGSSQPIVNVTNNVQAASISAETGSDGQVYVTVDEVRDIVASDVLRGGTNVSTAFEQTYKMSRGR